CGRFLLRPRLDYSAATVADFSTAALRLWGQRIGLEMDTSWPDWARLMNKVLERQTVKQALRQEGLA
ncbi:hypothetical protein AKG10_31780, partial [Shinella sp. GWS1]|uniref:hypothetical protein n=1 Tax=Shinella sp. GWS1 TaxID=1692240 RepID=UPI0006C371D5